MQSQLSHFYQYEGIGFYTAAAPTTGEGEIHRFYNHRAGGHFFTASEAERDIVIQNYGDTFQYEGIAFYA